MSNRSDIDFGVYKANEVIEKEINTAKLTETEVTKTRNAKRILKMAQEDLEAPCRVRVAKFVENLLTLSAYSQAFQTSLRTSKAKLIIESLISGRSIQFRLSLIFLQ